MIRRTLLVAGFILFTVSLAATVSATTHSRTIPIGETETVTASVSNPLHVPDVLHVSFNGDAVAQGIVDLELPERETRLDCSATEKTCEVALDPGSERDIKFSITGRHAGTAPFQVRVSSETTGKRAEAITQITVEQTGEEDGFMSFLNRLLGII